MRNILLRFNEQDEIIQLVDKVSKKLGTSASSLTKTALYFYCSQFEKGGKADEQTITAN